MGDLVVGKWLGNEYHGWYVISGGNTYLGPQYATLHLIELSEGSFGHGGDGVVPYDYVRHQPGSNFFWVSEAHPASIPSTDQEIPKVSYQTSTERSGGSTKVGKLWISSVDETHEK